MCEPGNYSASMGSIACDPCPLGGYCPLSGASSVAIAFTPCPVGTYNDKRGSSHENECTPCPVGTSNSLQGQNSSDACAVCPPGTHAGTSGSYICTACGNGFYQPVAGASSCMLCPSGSWCSGGHAFECAPNSYGDVSIPVELRTSQHACKSCGPNSATNGSGHDSAAACDCNPSFYRYNVSSLTCKPCPVPGSDCHEGGAMLATLRLEPGYWRANLGTIDVRRCPDATKGILSGCTGLPETPCRTGLTGVYCLFCTNSSMWFSAADSTCYECGGAAVAFPAVAGTLVAALVAMLLCWSAWRYRKLTPEPQGETSTGSPSMANPLQIQLLAPARADVTDEDPSELRKSRYWKLVTAARAFMLHLLAFLAPHFKIIWSFYQVLTLVPDVYGVTLPPSIHDLVDSIRRLVQINIHFAEAPLQCLELGGYLPWLTLVTTTPLVLMLLTPIVGFWDALRTTALRGGPGSLPSWRAFGSQCLRRAMDTATRSLLIETAYRTLFFEQLLSFVTFPFVCSTAFEAFECEEIDTSEYRLIADYNIRAAAALELTLQPASVHFAQSEFAPPAAECGTQEHTIIAIIAAFVIVLHSLAIPSCFLVLLVYSQRSEHASPQLRQALAFLHGPFEAHSYAWEFVEMVKSEEKPRPPATTHPQA